MIRSDIRISRVVAVALLIAAAPLSAQDMDGVVAFRSVTNAVCSGSCDSLAKGRRNDDAALRAVLASVPVARRPLGFVLRTKLVQNGTELTMISWPWALFPNGTASGCYGWDPRRTAPSPTGLRAFEKDCEIASWRRTANGIVLTEPEEDVSEPLALADIRKFTPGQRLAQRMRSYGPSFATNGSSMVNIDEMVMASSGAVRFANSRRFRQGGDGTDRTRTDDGRYYFDGYLAAVQFPDGRIEVVITGHVSDDSKRADFSFIFWNGVSFTRE